eukprot:CAMPEP_0204205744 /NCGR_PEP_ID=MMETSP0361-20130328/70557_1 /ASSEMBLY_ACC=CAM_ASM_000343 /TAXON_ID=268821 /ORGANISM="Scrippsiella Hangoei, Strain SHTV-5" /LENGTH=408 /DNA_ID=CAMNT_0051169055 /DNA_START=37 /DNA_END=1260 /DNA_ORIENTATION=-
MLARAHQMRLPWRSCRCLCTSAPRRGTDTDDLVMGARAAQRTNKMVDRLSNMYVGKNHGFDRKYAKSYERVFGAVEKEVAADVEQDVLFGRGPLGMEIEWSMPPVVTAVVEGGAAHKAGVRADSVITHINGVDASLPMPDLELDELMQWRPLRLQLIARTAYSKEIQGERAELKPADAVRRHGVAKVAVALRPATCAALLEFVLAERSRCAAEVEAEPALGADRFSEVQTPRAGQDQPITRWDMRLPLAPVVHDALRELLAGGDGTLGSTFELLTGGSGAELWELGVVVSEPGAAGQPVHFDAPARCLFSAFVALQDVAPEMGPTMFLPGTHTQVAHRRFEAHRAAFVQEAPATVARLSAGDAVVYDSRVLHCGGENISTSQRILMYITFRCGDVDAQALGIHQHSIR